MKQELTQLPLPLHTTPAPHGVPAAADMAQTAPLLVLDEEEVEVEDDVEEEVEEELEVPPDAAPEEELAAPAGTLVPQVPSAQTWSLQE